jgi:hypothetical protein
LPEVGARANRAPGTGAHLDLRMPGRAAVERVGDEGLAPLGPGLPEVACGVDLDRGEEVPLGAVRAARGKGHPSVSGYERRPSVGGHEDVTVRRVDGEPANASCSVRLVDHRRWVVYGIGWGVGDPVVRGHEEVATLCLAVGREVDAPTGRTAVGIVVAHPLAIGARKAGLARCECLPLVQGADRAVARQGLEIRTEHVTVPGERDLGISAPVLAVRLVRASDYVPLESLVGGLPEPGGLRGAPSRAAHVDPTVVVRRRAPQPYGWGRSRWRGQT